MNVVKELEVAEEDILDEASEALQRAHLAHYEASGPEDSRRRLKNLFLLVLDCLGDRTLSPICRFAEDVAKARFDAGFDIAEVQTAFNVLEEAIWHVVITRVPPEDLAEATGLVGTVLGAGKDVLARTWVSLATSRHVPSLDLSALFEGAGN